MRSIKSMLKDVLPPKAFMALRAINRLPRVMRDPDHYSFGFGPLTYNQDSLATITSCDFMSDPLFVEAYRLGKSTGSWGKTEPAWRVYILCWAAKRGTSLEGDFVECGVNKGGASRSIIHYVGFENLDKKYYLLDTFSGLSEIHLTEEERRIGLMERWGHIYVGDCYEEVKKTFSSFPNIEIIKGTVPETLHKVQASKVCYLSIDMNCSEPEIAAAEFFWDKLVPGAAIIFDDHGWPNTLHQKQAHKAFAKHKNVEILQLPTGQGLIIKP